MPGDGLYGDVASVAVHNLLAQAKPDAGAVGFGAEEGNEYLVLYVGQDAVTVVADCDQALPGKAGDDLDVYPRMLLFATCFHGVFYQID